MAKILLAVSDRWVPDARVDAIGDFARKVDKTILAVHVAYGTEGSAADKSPGERVLEQIANRLKERSARVESLLLISDDVGVALTKTAEEHGATMIVVGLSSKGMLARLIEGNVAQEVIRSTRIPLLLLPEEWTGEI